MSALPRLVDPPVSFVPTVLFVGGYARSGSTLLDIVLGSAPGTCAVGEVRFIWQRGFREDQSCACGARFSACPFWRAVVSSAFGGPDGIDVDAVLTWQHEVDQWWNVPRFLLGRGGHAFDRSLRAYAGVMSKLYRAIGEVSGARLIVDSSKDASHGYVLRTMRPGIDLRVLHLIRDGRATAYSLCERKKFDPATGRDLATHGYLRASVGWAGTNLLVEGLGVDAKDAYARLRYEDFARNPEQALRRIAGLTGVEPPVLGRPGDVVDLDAVHHTVAGNPMRFDRGSVRIVPDEAWRTSMTRRGRWTVSALTWPLLFRYGVRPAA